MGNGVTTDQGPDDCLALLHGSGWSVGEVRAGRAWQVDRTNGENVIQATGATQAEAWQRACEQAQSVGRLRRVTP
jgi:hypothetical protein